MSPATNFERRRVGEMPKQTRKKKVCKSRKKTSKKGKLWLYNDFEEDFGSLSNSSQGTLSKLSKEVVSNLSETVVSLASFNGDQVHAICTGIVVKNEECGTSIVTSAILVRSFDIDNGCKFLPGLMIEVTLPNDRIASGWLAHLDLNYNVAVVNISYYPGFRAAHIDDPMQFGRMQFGSDSKVVALGRCFNTGKLKALYGIVTDDPKRVLRKDLMISTCKINLVMNGGPLVDLDGKFVGMNFYSMDEKMTPFLPMDKIYICLVHAAICGLEIKHGGDSTIKRNPCEIQECRMPDVEGIPCVERDKNQELSISSPSYSEGSEDFEEEEELWRILDPNPLPVDDFTELVRNDLKSRSYPMPIRLEGGMRLINTFEEEFIEDALSKLSKKVASGVSRSVVSLASFKGEERFFVCTGILLGSSGSTSRILTSASLVRTSADEYKIANNLRVKVYLPNGTVAEGTLQHYNLSYNIAVVSVMGFRYLGDAELHNQSKIEPHMEVFAVGRIFESGKLMATSGIVADKEGSLDCKELMISTCKVTKAGIGGPLIDLDGNFVGMNFHGIEKTHFLPWSKVLELLRRFKRSDADVASDKMLYRWHVPEPRWSYPRSRSPQAWTIDGLYNLFEIHP